MTNRFQQVVVDGCTSNKARVTSGVPQGTVLGPLLFLTYINDIHEELSSTIRLFADDALVYRPIRSQVDADDLQNDINILTNWTRKWQMSFNTKKCYVMRAHRGKTGITHDYNMDGTPLTQVEHHPYLGVELQNNMQWSEHISTVKNKSTRVLNLMRRNFSRGTTVSTRDTIYKSLVRPHLEYCSSVWDPSNRTDVDKLEAVQNKAARFVMQKHRRRESVSAMKRELEWQSLQERRFISRQKAMFKAVHGLHALEIPPYVHKPSKPLRQQHPHTYAVMRANVNAYRFSYLPRTIRGWNLLPSFIVCATSFDVFSNRLVTSIAQGIIVITYPKQVPYVCASPLVVPTTGQPLFIY